MPAPRHTEPQPKFSAFAVMILILLGIFALMSRADTIFKNCAPIVKELTDIEEVAEKTPASTQQQSRQIKTSVECNEVEIPSCSEMYKEEVASGNAVREMPSPVEETVKVSPPPPVQDDYYEIDENVALPPFPVVPSKPERGDKLSKDFAMLSDMIPAEAMNRGPQVKPSEPVRFQTSSGTPVLREKRYYVMRKDDTLWKISARFYGSGKHWQKIVNANPGMAPEKIRPGSRIVLPRLSCEKSLLTGSFSD